VRDELSVFPVSILLLGLVACSARAGGAETGVTPSSRAVASAQKAAPDTSLVGIAALMVRATPAVGRVWPGYWPREQAFLLLHPTDTALLVTPRTAPPEYVPFSAPRVPSELRGRAYLREGYLPGFKPNQFSVSYALGNDTVPALEPKGSALFDKLDFYYHEAFHGFQHTAFADPPNEPQTKLGKPSVDPAHIAAPEFRALVEVERHLLHAALGVEDTNRLRPLLGQYLAVRQTRSGEFSDVRAVERSFERREGTAQLVGCAAATAALGQGPARVAQCIRKELEEDIDGYANFPEADARLMRWPHYGTGAALGLLLDRLGADWRAAVERGTNLDQILADAVDFDATQASALAKSALAEFGYEKLLREAREARSKAGS
jgi:hypothetical protein